MPLFLRNVLESWNWFSEHVCVFLSKSCHQNGVRLPKTFFPSINSFKSVLRMDVRENTTFVADFGQLLLFFSNMGNKVAWQKFLASGPSGGKKNTTFRKKSRFFWPAWIFTIISRKRAMPEISAGPQNFRIQIFFCLHVKKSCYGFGRPRWTLTLNNLKI